MWGGLLVVSLSLTLSPPPLSPTPEGSETTQTRSQLGSERGMPCTPAPYLIRNPRPANFKSRATSIISWHLAGILGPIIGPEEGIPLVGICWIMYSIQLH